MIEYVKIDLFPLFIVSVLIFSGCGGNDSSNVGGDIEQEGQPSENFESVPKLSSSKRPNLNISILLDLSDRIDSVKYSNPAMEYYRRDLGYVESIARAFTNHCLNKKVVTMDDRLQVFVEPTPASSEINQWLNELKIDVNRGNVTKEILSAIVPTYQENLEKIYRSTIREHVYPGSDIWGFFDEKAVDYCVKPNHRNILFVLTDGYLYYKHNQRVSDDGKSNRLIPQDLDSKGLLGNNWKEEVDRQGYGFIVSNESGLEELEVFVIGLNGYKKSPYAEDVIKHFWTNWMDGMGVKGYKLKSSDLPSNMDELISDYVYLES